MAFIEMEVLGEKEWGRMTKKKKTTNSVLDTLIQVLFQLSTKQLPCVSEAQE